MPKSSHHMQQFGRVVSCLWSKGSHRNRTAALGPG